MRFYFFIKEQEKKSEVDSYLDEKKYTFFFEYENEIYAAEEDGRLIYAKMKCKDEDLPYDWKSDLKFLANKLVNNLKGEESSRYFGFKNLKNIKNLDREDVIKKIIKNKNYDGFQFSK